MMYKNNNSTQKIWIYNIQLYLFGDQFFRVNGFIIFYNQIFDENL